MFEPRRLSEGAPRSELARALREARAQLGDARRLAALHARLGAELGPTGAPAAGAGAASAPIAAKTALLLLALAGLAALHGTRAATERAPRPVPRATAMPAPGAPHVARSDQHAASEQRATDEQGARKPARAPDPAPRTRATQPRAARTHARAAVPAAAAAQRPDPEAELALISNAAHALPRDPEQALGLLVEHARRFPRGLLCEERDGLRIDALLALQRDAQAKRAAHTFLLRYPSSPQGPRLRRLLAQQSAAPAHNASAPRTPTE